MKIFSGFFRDRCGWITWIWSKAGVMIFFFAVLSIMVSMYNQIDGINRSDTANQISKQLADTIVQVYSGSSGMKTIFELPAVLNGEEYTMKIINKSDASGQKYGILISASGDELIKGGSSFTVPLDYQNSILHEGKIPVMLCISNTGARVNINTIDNKEDCIH